MFAFKSNYIDENIYLREYVSQFAETDCTTDQRFTCDVDSYINTLNDVLFPEMAVFEIECLIYTAGYAVLSYFEKSNVCRACHDYLATNNRLLVTNDFRCQYT